MKYFYSPLARAIENAPKALEKSCASAWLAWIHSNAATLGVKRDEVEWSGIDEYLASEPRRQELFRRLNLAPDFWQVLAKGNAIQSGECL